MTKSIKNNYMFQNGGGGSKLSSNVDENNPINVNENNPINVNENNPINVNEKLKQILIGFIDKIPNKNIEPKLNELFKSLIPIPQVGPIQVPTLPSQVSTQAPKLPPRPSLNTVQKGGNTNTDKLKNNIVRLYNCYELLQLYNQNGGIDNKLSFQVKKRLDKKIAELIIKPAYGLPVHIHTNYLKDLEGGVENEDQIIRDGLTNIINEELDNSSINNVFTPALLTNILIIDDKNNIFKNIFKDIKIPILIPNIGVLISKEFFKLIIKDLDLTPIKKHIKEGDGNNLRGGFDIWHDIKTNIIAKIQIFQELGRFFTNLFNWRMPDLSNLAKNTVLGRKNAEGR